MEEIVALEELDAHNWLKVCELDVTEEQKEFFPIPNVYWIGISRYEEKTTLFAIKNGTGYVGLIGGGFDEDGVSGYINPLMIDKKCQHQGYARKAMELMISYLKEELKVSVINIGHRKTNIMASKLYDQLRFKIVDENENDYLRSLNV